MHLGAGMGCFHVSSPSPAAFSVAQQPFAAAASFRPVVCRRRAHSLCSPSPLRLQAMLRPAETPPRPRLAIRAQNRAGDGDGDQLPLKRAKKPHNFPKEGRHISSYLCELMRVSNGLLQYEAGGNTRYLCGSAQNAVTMASNVVDSATLNNPTTPGEISRETVHRTVGAYVQIFVQTADETFNNSVTKETITSFLGALAGLASVAHILLQAALEGLGHENPKESLSEYAFNGDVKKMHRVYHRRMRQLQDGIRNSPSEMHTCKILMPTIFEGTKATQSFVKLMMARRKRTLEKTQSTQVVE